MRILLFTTAYRPLVGGSEIAIESIARQMPEVFFDVVTPRYRTDLLKYENQDNVAIHRVGFGGKADKFLFPVLGVLKGWSLRRKYHYAVMHAYQASHAAGAAWILRMFFSRPAFLLTMQEGKDLGRQNIFVKTFRWLIIKRADSLTAISNYLRNYILKRRQNVSVTLVPNGVDVELFSDVPRQAVMAAKEHASLRVDRATVVTVSRLVPKNGLENLIRSLLVIRKERPVQLLIVGSGPMQKELQRLASKYGIDDAVIFAGTVPHSRLAGYLATGDVFVRASLSEGMGNVFLEAMAAGIPVVGSDVGGISDFLRDGETGLVCNPLDPESIARAVLRVLKDDELKTKIVQNAKQLVKEKYDWNIIANQMKAVYESI